MRLMIIMHDRMDFVKIDNNIRRAI